MNMQLDMRRMRLLLRTLWLLHRSDYRREFGFVLFAVPFIIYVDLAFYRDGNHVDVGRVVDSLFNLLTVLMGVFYAQLMVRGFSFVGIGRREVRALLLPASSAEKFVAMLSFTMVVGTVVFLAAMLAGWALMMGALRWSDATIYHDMMAVMFAGSPMQWPLVEGVVTIVVGGLLLLSFMLFYKFAFTGGMKMRFYFYTLVMAEAALFVLITYLSGSWAGARIMNGVVALTLFGIQIVAAYHKFCQIQINQKRGE